MQADSPCIHCGLCLDSCATYRVLGNEADSPRGRVYLMSAIERRQLRLDREVAGHLERCLGCLACETACPSGVHFGRRIDALRPSLDHRRWLVRTKTIVMRVLASRASLALALGLSRAADAAGLEPWRRRLPWLGLLPKNGQPFRQRAARRYAVQGSASPQGARVLLFHGCLADTLRPSINRAAQATLEHNGYRVLDGASGCCCGALALHAGAEKEARYRARATLE